MHIPPAHPPEIDRGGTQRGPSLPPWVLRLPSGATVVARVEGLGPCGPILGFRDGPGRFILSRGPGPPPAKGAEVELVVTRDAAGRTALQLQPSRATVSPPPGRHLPPPQGEPRNAAAARWPHYRGGGPAADRPFEDAATPSPRPVDDGRLMAGRAASFLPSGDRPVRCDERRPRTRAGGGPGAVPGRGTEESRATLEVQLPGGLGPVRIEVQRRGGLLTVDLQLADARRAALCAHRLPCLAAALARCQGLPAQLGCVGADGDGRYLWRPGEGSGP